MKIEIEGEKYCTDCNGEAAVKLKDCPRYKEEIRKKEKEDKDK